MKVQLYAQTQKSKTEQKLALYSDRIPAGFPSPADDFLESKLDLNDYLIDKPNSTFLVKASGESMIEAGIFNTDLLVVDRSIRPQSNHIVIAAINGELLVKRFIQKGTRCELHSANNNYPPIPLTEEDDLVIWGVVTYVIHKPV